MPAAGAKILAMLTVNHYIYNLKLFEIDATHTLLTTTNEYASTDYYDDTLATMTKATVSLPYLPALLTAWPASIWSSNLK